MSDLTTLTNVKQWLGLTTAGADAQLSRLITAVSADFQRLANRPDLLQANYTGEVQTGDGGRRLVPYHWPIASVTSLTVAGVTVAVSPDKVASGYYFDADIDPERNRALYLVGSTFKDGQPVVLTYSAGYTVVPGDVEQAVIDWVAYRFKGAPNTGTQQRRSAEGESVQVEQTDMPPHVQQVIDRYTRCLPGLNRREDDQRRQLERAQGNTRGRRG